MKRILVQDIELRMGSHLRNPNGTHTITLPAGTVIDKIYVSNNMANCWVEWDGGRGKLNTIIPFAMSYNYDKIAKPIN